MNKAIDEVIHCITDSLEYKKCLELKEKMASNEEIVSLVDEVKSLQKKYVKSGYSDSIKEELEDCHNRLNSIPIYNDYNKYLKVVNDKISNVIEFLNDYFYGVLNN